MTASPRREYTGALVLIGGGSAIALAAAQTLSSGDKPVVVALSLVGLAGVLGVVATRGILRRGVGVLLALVGAGIVADSAQLAAWLVLVGGLLVVAGGLLTAWHGPRWAVMSARYDAPRAAHPGDAWTALDRGDDPTVDEPDDLP